MNNTPTKKKNDGQESTQLNIAHEALWSRPGFLVRRLHQIHIAMFLEECAGFNITPVQFGLLTILQHVPGIDQATLGAETGIDRTNVADVLTRLEKIKFIRRITNPKDRRMRLVTITRKGEAFIEKTQSRVEKAQQRLLEPLSSNDQAKFLSLLRKLIEANNHSGRAPLRTKSHTGSK
ncbi:MAG: MarR family transcriptional regulator [Rhodospirillales bacterium]|jgi:DNA-binding MarR family transcriptional regulator|nr:MarR family transcriptional regulator [Rhodospirillales bacterium]|tara:strand:- start:1 stop:534 length:534 start_codon:yes stop_codon:yes gene_type:complete